MAPRRPKRSPKRPKKAPRRHHEGPKRATNNSKIELSAPTNPRGPLVGSLGRLGGFLRAFGGLLGHS
eukprot:2551016-Pyramimonas_sp.AAC.1